MQPADGNLVEYENWTQPVWASGGAGAGASVTMQGDGNLVVYNGGIAKWFSSTAGFSGAALQLQDDGNLVIYQDGHPVWDRVAGYTGDRLMDQQTLSPGAYLLSPGGQYELIMQPADGNLVEYKNWTQPVWASGAAGAGASVTMQSDGNFVIYNGGVARWNSQTAGHANARLVLQDDSNLVIYDGSTAIWDRASGLLQGGGPPAGGTGQAIVNAAASQAGRTYCWDGGNENGPTHGAGDYAGEAPDCAGASTLGFDCTGLTQYAVYQGTGGAVDLTHHDSQQALYAPGQWITSEAALQPGDVVYFGSSRSDITHAAIYAGVVNGQQMIWDADTAFWIYPDGVHERTLASENSLGFVGAARVAGG